MKGMFKTLRSFRKSPGSQLYSLDYTADYQLDRLLEMGAGSDSEFAGNVCKLLLNGLPVKVKPEGSCSTFVAGTPEGDRLFARNFDYKCGMAMLVKASPRKGYRSVALSNLGHIGFNNDNLPEKGFINRFKTLASVYSPLDGMNEAGFAVAVNTAAEQVTRQDMNSSGKIGYHFQLADRKGCSAIVEYIDNEMVIIRREKKDSCFCLTNFTISTEEKNGTGKERFEIMEECLNENGSVLSEKNAMNLLDKAQMDGHKYYQPGHMYYDSKTQWSVVYNLSRRTASIAVGSDFSRTFDVSLECK